MSVRLPRVCWSRACSSSAVSSSAASSPSTRSHSSPDDCGMTCSTAKAESGWRSPRAGGWARRLVGGWLGPAGAGRGLGRVPGSTVVPFDGRQCVPPRGRDGGVAVSNDAAPVSHAYAFGRVAHHWVERTFEVCGAPPLPCEHTSSGVLAETPTLRRSRSDPGRGLVSPAGQGPSSHRSRPEQERGERGRCFVGGGGLVVPGRAAPPRAGHCGRPAATARTGSGGGAGDGARGERGQHLLQGSHEVQLERGE